MSRDRVRDTESMITEAELIAIGPFEEYEKPVRGFQPGVYVNLHDFQMSHEAMTEGVRRYEDAYRRQFEEQTRGRFLNRHDREEFGPVSVDPRRQIVEYINPAGERMELSFDMLRNIGDHFRAHPGLDYVEFHAGFEPAMEPIYQLGETVPQPLGRRIQLRRISREEFTTLRRRIEQYRYLHREDPFMERF